MRFSNFFFAGVVLLIFWFAQSIIFIALDQQNDVKQHGRVRTLLIDLLNAETGQRGYIITGDESYLEPYRLAKRQFDTDREDMIAAIGNMPDIIEIDKISKLKFAEMEKSIEIRKKDGVMEAAKFVGSDLGKNYMDRIRGFADTLLSQAENRMIIKQARITYLLNVLKTILTASFMLAIVVNVGAFVLYKFQTRSTTSILHRKQM
jgi:CHASE3 domain sensor protein